MSSLYISAAKNLSVVVITLNEEKSLPRLLASLPEGVELIVVDSGSTDQTKIIAENANALFQVRPFDNYGSQKNAALKLATRPWVLSLDADEVPSKELWQNILDAVAKNQTRLAYRLTRRQIFLGKRLRFGKTKDSPLRLFAKGQGQFENEIHEVVKLAADVSVSKLSGTMDHFSYSSLSDYFSRFNRYTSAVAERHDKNNARVPGHLEQGLRFCLEFKYRYLLRGGFLDGYPGFVYALFGSVYVFVKYAKLEERRRLVEGSKK